MTTAAQPMPTPMYRKVFDSLIVGYLHRQHYSQSAAILEKESPELSNITPHCFSEPMNDLVHGKHLQEIMQLFIEKGHFEIAPAILDFGNRLRSLANEFAVLTNGGAYWSETQRILYGKKVANRTNSHGSQDMVHPMVYPNAGTMPECGSGIGMMPECGSGIGTMPECEPVVECGSDTQYASTSAKRKSAHPVNMDIRRKEMLKEVLEQGIQQVMDGAVSSESNTSVTSIPIDEAAYGTLERYLSRDSLHDIVASFEKDIPMTLFDELSSFPSALEQDQGYWPSEETEPLSRPCVTHAAPFKTNPLVDHSQEHTVMWIDATSSSSDISRTHNNNTTDCATARSDSCSNSEQGIEQYCMTARDDEEVIRKQEQAEKESRERERIRIEEERLRLIEEEEKRLKEEADKRLEQEHRKAQERERRRFKEEERKLKEERERKRLEEEQRRGQEKERKRLEEEKRLKEERERKRLEGEQRKAEEKERKRLEEEQRKAEEKERKRLQEEQRKAEEKERKRLEEEQRKAQERKRLEEEKRLKEEAEKKEEERKRQQEEEEEKRLKEEERVRIEEEEVRKRNEERLKQEEEAIQKEEEEVRRIEEEKRRVGEELRRRAEERQKKDEEEAELRKELARIEEETLRMEETRKRAEEKRKQDAEQAFIKQQQQIENRKRCEEQLIEKQIEQNLRKMGEELRKREEEDRAKEQEEKMKLEAVFRKRKGVKRVDISQSVTDETDDHQPEEDIVSIEGEDVLKQGEESCKEDSSIRKQRNKKDRRSNGDHHHSKASKDRKPESESDRKRKDRGEKMRKEQEEVQRQLKEQAEKERKRAAEREKRRQDETKQELEQQNKRRKEKALRESKDRVKGHERSPKHHPSTKPRPPEMDVSYLFDEPSNSNETTPSRSKNKQHTSMDSSIDRKRPRAPLPSSGSRGSKDRPTPRSEKRCVKSKSIKPTLSLDDLFSYMTLPPKPGSSCKDPSPPREPPKKVVVSGVDRRRVNPLFGGGHSAKVGMVFEKATRKRARLEHEERLRTSDKSQGSIQETEECVASTSKEKVDTCKGARQSSRSLIQDTSHPRKRILDLPIPKTVDLLADILTPKQTLIERYVPTRIPPDSSTPLTPRDAPSSESISTCAPSDNGYSPTSTEPAVTKKPRLADNDITSVLNALHNWQD